MMTLLVLSSCGKAKKIPDDTLQDVIKEIFMTNAYIRQNHNYALDTVSVYEPILKRYGYRPKDLDYTLYKMSLRKSSHISEILNSVAEELEAEYKVMTDRRDLKALIDTRTVDTYKDTLLMRDSIKISTIKELEKGNVNLDLEKGDYKILFFASVDEEDENYTYRFEYQIKNDKDSVLRSDNYYYSRGKRQMISKDFVVADTIMKKISISLSKPMNSKIKKPQLKLDSVLITRTPALKEARVKVDSILLRKISPIHKFIEYGKVTKDSLTIDAVPPMRGDTIRRTDI